MRVHGNGDFPEGETGEGACVDMIKFRLLLVLDGVFEDADRTLLPSTQQFKLSCSVAAMTRSESSESSIASSSLIPYDISMQGFSCPIGRASLM
jgi:hypothetical protein